MVHLLGLRERSLVIIISKEALVLLSSVILPSNLPSESGSLCFASNAKLSVSDSRRV